ncbi:hypothetical protein ACU4GD_38440 [Cupriavidus basilensis]
MEFGLAREVMKNGRGGGRLDVYRSPAWRRALEVEGALMLVDSVSNSLTRHSQALIALARPSVRDDYTSICIPSRSAR